MNEVDRKKLEASLSSVLIKARNPEGAKNILAMLFPKAENVLRTFITGESDANTQKIKRRISQKDFTADYFSLSSQTDFWSRSEFETVMAGLPQEAFNQLREKVEHSTEQKKSDVRRVFLDLLQSKFTSTQKLNQEWLDAIISASPYLLSKKDEDSQFFFSVENEDRLRWIIVRGLRQLSTPDQINLLKSAIQTAGDLTVLTDVVRSVTGDSNPDGSKTTRQDFSWGTERTIIRDLLLGRIKSASETGEIWTQARPDRLLWFWWGTDAAGEVKSFTERAMSSPIGLKKLLEISVSEVKSTAGNYERVPSSWEKIVDLDALAKFASELLKTKNSDIDDKLARRFLAALARGREDPF